MFDVGFKQIYHRLSNTLSNPPYSGNSGVNNISGGATKYNHPAVVIGRFSESKECSEAECDRERALDLEVQSVMANVDANQMDREEITTLLERCIVHYIE